MRIGVIAAVLAASGCGVIYTSPSVHDSASGTGPRAPFDVVVTPLTLETAMDANLSAYVPARLPDAFRPAPPTETPAIAGGGGRMPDIPSPEIRETREGAGLDDELPPAATALETPAGALEVDLPPDVPAEPYRIGVADVLLLSANTSGATLSDVPSLLNAQSSRQGYIVQDDGAIAVPDVGRVRVAGLTLEEAEAEIFQALVAQRVDPSFSLEVAEFNSQRVSVGGAVRAPMVQPISLKPLHLSEALQFAGGVPPSEADHAVVRLFREGQVFQVPLRRLYDPAGLVDVLLRDGDAVYVDADYDVTQARAYFEEQLRLREARLREREFAFRQREADISEVQFSIALAQFELQKAQLRQQIDQMRISAAGYQIQRNADLRLASADARAAFQQRVDLGAVARDYAYVAGEVYNPRRFALPFESRATLADVLFEERGLNVNFGDYSEIYLLRPGMDGAPPGMVTAYHLDAANAAAIVTATRMELRPNDVVFVAEQPVTTWNRIINQLTPNLLSQAASLANAN